MPKFHKQNKRKINPRYFLDETVQEGILSKMLGKSSDGKEYMSRLDNIVNYLNDQADKMVKNNVANYLRAYLKSDPKGSSKKMVPWLIKGYFPDYKIKSDALKKLVYDFQSVNLNHKDLQSILASIESAN